jgi:hypothetical protein
MLLGGKDLAFYQYKEDVNTLLDKVCWLDRIVGVCGRAWSWPAAKPAHKHGVWQGRACGCSAATVPVAVAGTLFCE